MYNEFSNGRVEHGSDKAEPNEIGALPVRAYILSDLVRELADHSGRFHVEWLAHHLADGEPVPAEDLAALTEEVEALTRGDVFISNKGEGEFMVGPLYKGPIKEIDSPEEARKPEPETVEAYIPTIPTQANRDQLEHMMRKALRPTKRHKPGSRRNRELHGA